jgi:hypothetical protein
MDGLFYSVGEMATILGVTERSVYRLNRKIPGWVKIGGRCYINRQTFLKATQGTQEPKEKGVASSARHGLI